ncbi:MAG: MATE family efflux transporter [Bacillota bacterium]|nr:MATE family efflux transporter [Bacillota bacterium]
MILGNVFQQFYTMVDTMVVGCFVSKDALADVGATGAFMLLMILVIIGFKVGTDIVTTQNEGAKNTKGIRSIFVIGSFIKGLITLPFQLHRVCWNWLLKSLSHTYFQYNLDTMVFGGLGHFLGWLRVHS